VSDDDLFVTLPPAWYVVQSRPRQERKALENLKRQGFDCIYPKTKVWRIRRGKRVQVTESLFPNYIFIYLTLGETNIEPIRSTYGVLRLVRFGEVIAPVPALLIRDIWQRMDDQEVVDSGRPQFESGERVRIEGGAFDGLEAIFQCESGEQRAILLLDLLGQEVRATVEMASLRQSG
jgi:transcriptional antiterminator RfaH